ncbi:MAG: membrane protein insertase YidC, partial [Betaproteobacteria bacterium]|nr:membrane protein insertase YidC [Betaproteobacteria bacterium]
MDTQRLILFFVFSFSLLLLWEAWQKEARPPATAPSPSQQAATPTPSPPTAAVSSAAPKGAEAVPAPGAVTVPGARQAVRVATDTLRADIDPLGGDITYLELLQHKDTLDKDKNFVLFGPEYRYAAQSGLIGIGLPNHKTLYAAPPSPVSLPAGKDSVSVRLEASGPEGVKVAKVLTFHRGSYLIDVAYEIANGSGAPLAAHAYFQLTRRSPPGDNAMMYTYTGAALYSEQDKYVKVAFGDMDKGKTPYAKMADNGWIGMVQHYFVSALVPPVKQPREFFTRRLAENFYSAGVILPLAAIAPGQAAKVSTALYAGPQEQDKLNAIAPGLEHVVDYGWLTVIAAPLFWVLQMFYGLVGNWGVAIILLTVVIKLIFFPLSAASYRSMAKMKVVTPRLMKLREQYGDDR